MSKIIVIPNSTKQLEQLIKNGKVDAIILGIEGLSTNLPFYSTLEQIKLILTNSNKEIFVSINKNIHNHELGHLEETMLELDKCNIQGIIYYDIALVNLKKRHSLKCPLVWGQEHLTTNYSTINYWEQFGASYCLLSAEITKEEIIEIRQNTEVKLILPIFGYLSMYTSARPVINNYLNYFDLKSDAKKHYISKEGHDYHVITNSNDTNIYSSNLLNGIEESIIFKREGIDYLLINLLDIDDDKVNIIISSFYEINDSNEKIVSDKINQIFQNKFDKGFLYKETVYKVKNNE